MGGKKIYIRRGHGGKSSSGDSRLGMMLGFLLSLILFASCLVVVVGRVRNLVRHDPDKFGPGEVIVSREMDFHFGPKDRLGTLSVAALRGNPVLIVGKVERDGWLLPDREPERFRKLAYGTPESNVPVLEHFDVHPYIPYAIQVSIFGVVGLFMGWLCLKYAIGWLGR